MRSLRLALGISALALLLPVSANATTLSFNSQGYSSGVLESAGSFTWFNIGGTGVNLTWSITGDPNVNDSIDGTGMRIGKNEGLSTGAVHNYVLTFSAPVANVQFTIQNINHGPQGTFNYHDLLTFTGAPSFSALGGGVTALGNQLLPPNGVSNSEQATVTYFNPLTSFTITHGLGGRLDDDPGFLYFEDISFEVVPEPASLVLLGTGLLGVVAMRRRLTKRS